jgi:hypothetical protein
MTRILCAFTSVVCILPAVTLGGLQHFNTHSAFVVAIGTLFSIAALLPHERKSK